MLFCWAATTIHLKKVIARIGYANSASVSLFQKLGFTLESQSDVFQEYTYALLLTPEIMSQLQNETAQCITSNYE